MDMMEVFKLLKGFDHIDPNKFLTLSKNDRLRGHNYKLAKFRSRLDIRKHYFSNRVVDAWNALPQNVVTADTVNLFKARLDRFIKNAPWWGHGESRSGY